MAMDIHLSETLAKEWSWALFNAFWDGMEYIVYLKGANGETKTTLAFDTGAVCTVVSIESLTKEFVDKSALCQELDQRVKRRRFLSASGTEMHGYLVCAEKVSLSDYPVDRFYYYLITDVNDEVALLGNDLLSCCKFSHEEMGDIEVLDFDQSLYQKTYSGAVKDADLQTLISEVTIPDA